MAKKQPPEERRPDLAEPDQEAAEQRVREMLEVEETPKPKTESAAKKIEVTLHEQEEEAISSAPELPTGEEKPEDQELETSKKELAEDEGADEQEPGTSNKEADEEADTEEVVAEVDEPEEDAPEAEDDELLDEEPKEKILNLDEAPKDAALIESVETKKPDDESEPEFTADKDEPDSEKLPDTDIDKVIKDVKTSRAVDEIVAGEGDELLAVADEKAEEEAAPKKPVTIAGKIGAFFKAWWNNPKARWATIVGVLLTLTVVYLIPTTRFFVFNSLGFRANASITVLDESTGQPLKNVEVTLANASGRTDSNGFASLDKIKIGPAELVVKKRAFAESKQKMTVLLGHLKLEDLRLKPTGTQYSFVVTDYLSGKPIAKLEAISGEASAFSDEKGKIKLTVDRIAEKDAFDVSFKKEDYREDKVSVNSDDKSEKPIIMTLSRRHIFVSKRSGKYDVYSINIDGKNEKQLLAGTGTERDDIALALHPTTSVAALVSTRDNKNNADGFLLSTLTIIDDESGKTVSADSSERFQLIDWIGDNLIYVKAIAGASAGNPKRNRLINYNYKTNQSHEIAASNYFNDVIVAGDKIYYSPSSAGNPNDAKLYRVNADGGGRITVVNQEVWNIFRLDYENLALSANKNWLNIRIGEDKATAITTQPTNPKSRIYVTSKDGKNSLWVDNRDGKGALVDYEVSTKNEQVLQSQSGLKYPVYWPTSRAVIYRISSEQETADYALSLDGGTPHKIGDVTNTNSIEQWYYY